MSLTLAQGRNDVRVLTRHVGDTVRLTVDTLDTFLNETYRELRTWLMDIAPSLYLAESGEIAIPDATTGQEIILSSDLYTFERLYLIERLHGERWVEVERARTTGYNSHATGLVTFRQEGTRVILAPDGEVEGTFRIKFHYTPAVLTDVDALFKLPEILLPVLKYRTCVKVAIADGDSPKDWIGLAQDSLTSAERALRGTYGAIPKRPGLRRRLGY